jgi:protein-disulfide isomerase
MRKALPLSQSASTQRLKAQFVREIMGFVLKSASSLRFLALLVGISTVGCHAQTAPLGPVEPGHKLSLEEARRVEVMIRSRSQMPPDFSVQIGTPVASDISGFAKLPVIYGSAPGNTRTIDFLISNDGKTLAQMNRFDLSEDPKQKIDIAGRPARGGPANAPVLIVAFDDLECPFCAKMHSQLFPALLERYKDQVHFVYRDFPLPQHPWAIHAAVDSNCLASQSEHAYWDYVDYVHAHAAEMGGADNTLDKAKHALDKIATDVGVKQKLDQPALEACVAKQDSTKVNASVLDASTDALRVDSTPTLFINGEKVEGVLPMNTIYGVIDRALVAAGQTPPPPPPPSATPAPPAAAKPGT